MSDIKVTPLGKLVYSYKLLNSIYQFDIQIEYRISIGFHTAYLIVNLKGDTWMKYIYNTDIPL